MGKNIVQKIIEKHLVEGELIPGKEIAVKIDQTLTQDATGTMAYLQFEALGIERVKTELSVSYVDHNTLQEGFENADDHRYLQTVAAKYGILYSRAGNGICHQVHLERFSAPGKTLLGSDSHTPTAGGIGSLAMGAGGLDVAVAMGGGAFHLACPKVTRVNLLGKLKPWVSAKDVVMRMLELFTTKGNVGTVMEYGGPGLRCLTVPERATITNMGAEMGVTTSIFPSDDVTRAFMKAQKRERMWKRLEADSGANYEAAIDVHLDKVVPLMACPHSPDNIKSVDELKGTKVNQVMIGSCTNSSYRDIMLVASLLKGKTVYPGTSLGVACGSRQVLEMAGRNGALADMVGAGARILESTCGFCIGNGQSPQTNAVSIRTSNRNFEGRSGTKSAQVYLSSPESAVAAALNGEIKDPRKFFARKPYPRIKQPRTFLVDDKMILKLSPKPQTVEVYRGPNIGDPPHNDPLAAEIAGRVMIKVGDKITTDHIMPAGPRLKYRSNINKYSSFVFESLKPEFAEQCLQNKEQGIHNMIVGGLSYGQGSSREHAALCPMCLGVKAVLAKSIERIHRANLVNFGIVPFTFVDGADYDQVQAEQELTVSGVREALAKDNRVTVENRTTGKSFVVEHDLTSREVDIVLAGGLLNYTKGS